MPDWAPHVRGRLSPLRLSRTRENEIVEELSQHLEDRWRELIAGGASEDEATRLALADFRDGNLLARYLAPLRQAHAPAPIIAGAPARFLPGDLWRDVRYAARTLRKSPGFSATAVLTLALGIGANTALFTIVDQVLLRFLPVNNPRELVSVASRGSYYGDNWGDGSGLSYPMYTELRDRNQAFAGMFARFTWELQARVHSRAERIQAEYVTGSYFPVLGVDAALGRTILPSDDAASAPDVAVLSHRYWRTALGADPNVIGTTIIANDHALTIVGVAQEDFDGTSLGVASQVFVPIRLVSALTPVGRVSERPILEDPRIRWALAFGRLRPGISLEQAQSQLQPLYAARLTWEIQEEGFTRASDAEKTRYLQSAIALRPAGDGRSSLRQQLTRPLLILMAIVGVVLLIACANLANLLLARVIARQREFALRLALGASRQRLARQLLTESVLLSVAGGMLGLVIATWGAGALLAYVPNPGVTLTVATAPDGRILAFTTIIAVVTATPTISIGVGVPGSRPNPTRVPMAGLPARYRSTKYTGVRDEIQPQLYFPFLEGPRVGVATMYVRTTQDPASALRTVEQVVRQQDPAMPIYDVQTLEDQVARSLSTDRLIANLAAVFGGLATLLAMIGLYGVLAIPSQGVPEKSVFASRWVR